MEVRLSEAQVGLSPTPGRGLSGRQVHGRPRLPSPRALINLLVKPGRVQRGRFQAPIKGSCAPEEAGLAAAPGGSTWPWLLPGGSHCCRRRQAWHLISQGQGHRKLPPRRVRLHSLLPPLRPVALLPGCPASGFLVSCQPLACESAQMSPRRLLWGSFRAARVAFWCFPRVGCA